MTDKKSIKEETKNDNKTKKTVKKEDIKDDKTKKANVKEEVKVTETDKTKTDKTEEVKTEEVKTEQPTRPKYGGKIRWALVNIYSSKNNTKITVTDLTGSETITSSSGGKVVKASREKGKSYAGMRSASEIADALKAKGIFGVNINIRAPGGHGPKTPGQGAQSVVRSLARMGLKVGKIEDVTPVPTDTTKRPGGRRGRRV